MTLRVIHPQALRYGLFLARRRRRGGDGAAETARRNQSHRDGEQFEQQANRVCSPRCVPYSVTRVPGQEELAFGAIASGGVRVRVLDSKILRSLPISSREIESITERARQELRVAKPPIAPTNHHSLLSERSQFSSTMALQPAQAFWQEFVPCDNSGLRRSWSPFLSLQLRFTIS